nr:hypothetical protein [Providencia stuartii]
MSDNIIKVNFTDETKPTLEAQIEDKRDFRQVQCKHYAVIVSEQHRTVKCKNCGCIVDAFDVFLLRANDAEHLFRQVSALTEQRDALRKSVDGLLREEKNTKARLRSARTDLAFIENKKLQHEGKVGWKAK